jgi:hypothetical protein
MDQAVYRAEQWGMISGATSNFATIWSNIQGALSSGDTILYPAGTFPFTAQPAALATSGVHHVGAAGYSTVLQRNYTPGAATDYFIAIETTNLVISDLYLDAATGTTTGHAIGCTATNANDWGDFSRVDVLVSGAGTWTRCFSFDGSGKTSGAVGIRDLVLKGYAFRPTEYGFFAHGIPGGQIDVAVYPSGTTPTNSVYMTGDATVYNTALTLRIDAAQDDISLDWLIDCNVRIGNCSALTIAANSDDNVITTGAINGNLTLAGDDNTLVGGECTGTISNTGTDNTYILGGSASFAGDITVNGGDINLPNSHSINGNSTDLTIDHSTAGTFSIDAATGSAVQQANGNFGFFCNSASEETGALNGIYVKSSNFAGFQFVDSSSTNSTGLQGYMSGGNAFIGNFNASGTMTFYSGASACVAWDASQNTTLYGNVNLSSGHGYQVNGTTVVDSDRVAIFRSYTVATVPSASGKGAGAEIFVTDETGGAIPAFSDGTNWRRYSDRAVVS